jgi:hypothetical protein
VQWFARRGEVSEEVTASKTSRLRARHSHGGPPGAALVRGALVSREGAK